MYMALTFFGVEQVLLAKPILYTEPYKTARWWFKTPQVPGINRLVEWSRSFYAERKRRANTTSGFIQIKICIDRFLLIMSSQPRTQLTKAQASLESMRS